MKPIELARVTIESQYPVILERIRKGLYRVTYGSHVRTYEGCSGDLHATAEFGHCVRHSLECAGKLD